MTPLQKRCQELLPVIMAGAEGRVIQRRIRDPLYGGWSVFRDGDTDFPGICDYRIKPEPQYRPFTPEEALKHCGKTIESPGRTAGIRSVEPAGVFLRNGDWHSFESLLENYRFALDGSPCGVEVTEP